MFSDQFRNAYSMIMAPQFASGTQQEQLDVVRILMTHMTSGLGTLGREIGKRDADLINVKKELTGMKTTNVRKDDRSILDHKAIMNMKTLSSDKMEFRLWYEKFVNAFEAAMKGSRTVIEAIASKIDHGEMYEDPADVEAWYDAIEVAGDAVMGGPLGWESMGERISFVLVDKCEGDARTRIRTRKWTRNFAICCTVQVVQWNHRAGALAKSH